MILTNRLFRNFLQSPRMDKVWRNARQIFIPPPPERPSVLSEPAYADLLWGERCQVCSSFFFRLPCPRLIHSTRVVEREVNVLLSALYIAVSAPSAMKPGEEAYSRVYLGS